MRILSPAEIATRLDDRFDLLETSGARQGTRDEALRTTIAWGYSVIGQREQ